MVKQGDIIKLNLDPKQSGYRTYICLSNKAIIETSNIAIFAPISNTKRNYPFYIPMSNTITTGKILLDQLVTIDFNARKYNFVETISEEFLEYILKVVKVNFEKDN